MSERAGVDVRLALKVRQSFRERYHVVSFDHFRQELLAQIARATARGQKDIVINALELHVALGVFANAKHHTAADAMESERKPGDSLVVERSHAAGLTIRYLLPRVLPSVRD